MINGHTFESSVKSFYGGKDVTIWCPHEDCYLLTKGEFSARDRAEELAEQYSCPMKPSKCVLCGDEIAKGRDICTECHFDTGHYVYDLDEEKSFNR